MFHALAGSRLLPKLPKPLLRLLLGLPRAPISREQRLAMFPQADLPLERPAVIRWNEHLVPYIEAETDRDLALCLGLVHAHLREAQMEFLKVLAFGRVAEILGPLALEVDKALRIVDFGHAVPEIERRLPAETRIWLESYCLGLNIYWARVPQRAPEFKLLSRGHQPWTVRDVLTVGRVIGADFSWLTYFSLLQERARPGFKELWRRVFEAGESAADPFGPGAGPTAIANILSSTNRAGSNSVAVGPARSASGAAMLASDPHLGLSLPNLWLLVGLRSPSYKLVGLSLPGLPVVGMGRTPDLAWGGTNLRAASTDLYDVSALEPSAVQKRKIKLKSRFIGGRTTEARWTPFGPILSDTKLFPSQGGEDIAFRWVGHEPTDEITALLAAAKARNHEELRLAFKGYGQTPLNVVFADRHGTIGLFLAVHQPVREQFAPADLVLDPADPATHWQGFVGAMDLPVILNPPDGVIASANNRPHGTKVPIGFLFGVESRLRRLYELLGRRQRLTFDDLALLQSDAGAPDAASLARSLADRLEAAGNDDDAIAGLAQRLRDWDGSYDAGSTGAPAFELLLAELAPPVFERAEGKGLPEQKGQWSHLWSYLIRDLDVLPLTARQTILRDAARSAARALPTWPTWGTMHRLKVAHFLSQVPVIGDAFVVGDLPASGSRQTPMKSAHGLVKGLHHATMGSMARHISDMADPDANWFALLGGQDGWFMAENFADQVPLWQERRYIRMPLRPEVVAREFTTTMRLQPARRPVAAETLETAPA